MARRRNPGNVLMPIMATPPFLRNARRETAIVISLVDRSAALKFRSAEHQSRDHAFVDMGNRVVKAGLHHTRIVHLLFERLPSLRRSLAGKQNGDGLIQHRTWLRRSVSA